MIITTASLSLNVLQIARHSGSLNEVATLPIAHHQTIVQQNRAPLTQPLGTLCEPSAYLGVKHLKKANTLTAESTGNCRRERTAAILTHAAKLFTNSTRLRSAIPDGPFAIQGF